MQGLRDMVVAAASVVPEYCPGTPIQGLGLCIASWSFTELWSLDAHEGDPVAADMWL
jgi:hypothetical protein